jgi:hypothetical protein
MLRLWLPAMDALSEHSWTLAAIAAVELFFVLWLASRAANRERASKVVASAELLGARARRVRS